MSFGFLTGCGSSSSTTPPPPPTLVITATSGSEQTANVGDAFTNMLVATVTSNGTAASGVVVTFTPVPGAVGQSCTPSATTVTTSSDGTASITCTANSTPGAYSVTAAATATGITATASFTEGNTAPRVLVFYVHGLENSPNYGPGPVYYAVAGAVGFDLSGKILGGEQDYNDGSGFTSPGEPTTPDVINPTGSSMTVDTTTGTGTLVLDVSASNPNVGVAGIETFGVQL